MRSYDFSFSSCAATIALALLIGVPACGDDGDGGPDVDAAVDQDGAIDPTLPPVDCIDVPGYSEMTVIFYCTGCHSSTNMGAARNGAPPGIDYDNYADAVVHAERGVRQLYAGTMPPGGAENIPQDQKDAFYTWALCGTPQ